MDFSKFFIDRPIFAGVLSLLIFLGGLIAVHEGMPARVFRALKEAVTPAPVPQRP